MHSITRRGRLAALAAVPLLIGSALVGCSSSPGSSGGAGDGTGTINVSNWDGGINKQVVAAFEKQYPEIKVNVQTYPDNYSAKVTTMIAGNKAPDVMLLFEADAIRLAKAKQIDDLSANLENDASLSESSFIPAVSTLSKQLNGTYGLPWCYASEVLYYNKDLFDQAGVKYPTADWTWDDYAAAAEELASGSGSAKVWGADKFSFPGIYYSLAGQAGDPVISSTGKLALGSGLERALTFTNDLTNVKKVQAQPSASGQSVTDLFASGKAAMTLNGSWAVGTYRDAKFNWDVAPMPKDKTSYVSLHTGFYTIYKNSKNKDAAWTFIKFMMSKAGQDITSSVTSNPSAITALSSSTDWQKGGSGGPTDWSAITGPAGTSGRFGYTLANPTVSGDLGTDFNSYLLGAESLSTVMQHAKAAATAKD